MVKDMPGNVNQKKGVTFGRQSWSPTNEYYQVYKRYYTMLMKIIHQENIAILNMYVPKNRASKHKAKRELK